MKVSLINYTPDALELLLFTKQTRLSMDAGLMEEIKSWPLTKKYDELHYMLGTIESSWEFVDYTFSIEGVSRAFTHQLVRTRAGSYAQQSQRTVDMTGFDFVMPDALDAVMQEVMQMHNEDTNLTYQNMIRNGANPQDARAILPTNVATNIIAKFNLRTLSDMAEKRLCFRTQGEFQQVFRAMREAVLAVHPWADEFIRVACAKRGVCQFPAFKECPIKPGIFNPDTGGVWPELNGDELEESISMRFPLPFTKNQIQIRWAGTKFEAVPKQQSK